MYLDVWPDGSLESLSLFVRTLRKLVDAGLIELIDDNNPQMVRIYTASYAVVSAILNDAGLNYRTVTPSSTP